LVVGALRAKRYLIIDRDTKYSQQFRRLLQDSGTKVIRLPPMSPNLKRNHQGLENRLIFPPAVETNDGTVHCHARLGETLNFYYRKAA